MSAIGVIATLTVAEGKNGITMMWRTAHCCVDSDFANL